MERLRNFVVGEWLDQGVDSTDINPSDVKDVIAEYAQADSKVTADAIEASSNAANKWGTSNVQQRADILDSIGDEILNKRIVEFQLCIVSSSIHHLLHIYSTYQCNILNLNLRLGNNFLQSFHTCKVGE